MAVPFLPLVRCFTFFATSNVLECLSNVLLETSYVSECFFHCEVLNSPYRDRTLSICSCSCASISALASLDVVELLGTITHEVCGCIVSTSTMPRSITFRLNLISSNLGAPSLCLRHFIH